MNTLEASMAPMKKKTLGQLILEMLAPKQAEDRRKFRIAIAKNIRSAHRLERSAHSYAEVAK